MPQGASAHLGNVGFREFITNTRPAARRRQQVDRAWIVQLVEQESVGDVAVGLVLGQHQNVRAVLVDAHGSTSSRIRALTRSPATWTSLTGRTSVGSRWLRRCSRSVFSPENRRIASGP